MPVDLAVSDPSTLHPVAGLTLGTAKAGIRKPNRRDLLVVKLGDGAQVAAVYTQNRFCAAPVIVGREHLAKGAIGAIVVNTGNANAGTGQTGIDNARQVCAALGKRLGLAPEQVVPMSTGVILEHLPVDRIEAGLDAAIADLAPSNWAEAAEAIMTTDTLPKARSRRIEVGGRHFTVTGIAKGAGMIRPNMATMLALVATDAPVSQATLQQWARRVADGTFNRITVDGDTSTNDTMLLVATGAAGGAELQVDDGATQALFDALVGVARELAQAIVRDGEGATKFITIDVLKAGNDREAAQVAYAIAHSPLVKTAFFASDPNLGRILAAIGYAGIDDLDPSLIDLYLDDVHVATGGGRNPAYQEADGQRVMKQNEITVRVVLNRGQASTTVWTCDLSHEYVSINADYRS